MAEMIELKCRDLLAWLCAWILAIACAPILIIAGIIDFITILKDTKKARRE